MTNKYNEYLDLRQKAQKALSEIGLDDFMEAAEAAFRAQPDMVALGWTQFTPYFNDGDPCLFRISDVYQVNQKGLEIFCKQNGYSDVSPLNLLGYDLEEPSYDSYLDEDYNDLFVYSQEYIFFTKMVNDKESMQRLFGDHTYVLVYKNEEEKLEVKKESYEHY